jgi:hypothetical protein
MRIGVQQTKLSVIMLRSEINRYTSPCTGIIDYLVINLNSIILKLSYCDLFLE